MKRIILILTGIITMFLALVAGGYLAIYKLLWMPLWTMMKIINSPERLSGFLVLKSFGCWFVGIMILVYALILYKVGEFILEGQLNKKESNNRPEPKN